MIDGAVQSGGLAPSHGQNNFDLLRLVFASIVLLSHSFELLDGNRAREPLTRLFHTISFGELGVDLFFILSGFLITASWDRDRRPLVFLRKRVLRIYPGFVVAFAVSVLVVGALGAPDASQYLGELDLPLLLRQGLFLQPPSTPPVFEPWAYPVVNGSTWTIRFEFSCYLLVLVLGVSQALAWQRLPVLLWAATLAAFAVFRWRMAGDPESGAIMGSGGVTMLRFLPLFFAGAALYSTNLYRYRPAWLLALAAGLLVAGLSFRVSAEVAVASVGAYLIIVVGFIPARLTTLRRLPDISYGVYLYAWPIQKLVIGAGVTQNPALVFALAWLLTLGAGAASWHLVERPALRLNRSLRIKAAALP